MNVREILERYKIEESYGEGECSIAGAVCIDFIKPRSSLVGYYSHPEPLFLAEVLSKVNTRIGEQLLIDMCDNIVTACIEGDDEYAINLLQRVLDYKE